MSDTDVLDLGTIDVAGQNVLDDGPPYELFPRMHRHKPTRGRALFLNQYNSMPVCRGS